MLFDIHFVVDFCNFPLGVYHERHPIGKAIGSQYPAGFCQFLGRICQQREIQCFLGSELVLVIEYIGTGTDNNRIQFGKIFLLLTEAVSFDRSATCHGFGKEPDHHVFAFQITDLDSFFFLTQYFFYVGHPHCNIRERVSYFQFFFSFF